MVIVKEYRANFNFCPLSEPRRAERQRHWPRMARYENTIRSITRVTSVPSEASVAGAPLAEAR